MLKSIVSKCILTFSSLILVSNEAFTETKLGLDNFKINPQSHIEFSSDSMTLSKKSGQANFFDNVLVKYGQLKLSAQKLIILQSKSGKEFKHLVFSASGPIIISNENNFIYGDEAKFVSEKQELTIIGNVKLNQKNNVITGDKLILNLQSGIARISGTVRTIIDTSGTLE